MHEFKPLCHMSVSSEQLPVVVLHLLSAYRETELLAVPGFLKVKRSVIPPGDLNLNLNSLLVTRQMTLFHQGVRMGERLVP